MRVLSLATLLLLQVGSVGCGRILFAPLDAGTDTGSSAVLDAATEFDVGLPSDAFSLDAPAALDGAPPVLDAFSLDARPDLDAPTVLDAASGMDAARLDARADGGRPPGAGPNVVFVTSGRLAGDFGGIEVADALCSTEAAAASLPGNFVAWLSSPTTPAVTRLGSASGWVRPDGLIVATSRAALVSSRLLHTITVHADGAPVSFNDPHVGGADDCASWTSASMAVMGGVGRLGSVEATLDSWGSGSSGRCSSVRPFLCFQIDHADDLPTPLPVAGRRMFVSGAAAGRTPDVTCQESADGAGLVGSFRAFVPFTGVSAVGRFTLDGRPWVALDGLVVFQDDAAVLAGSPSAPVMYTASGGVPVGLVVTGNNDPNRAGTMLDTCADWTATGPASSLVGVPLWGGRGWFGWGVATCADHTSPVFYCAED